MVEVAIGDDIIYPVNLTWVIYLENEVNRLFLEKVDEKIINNIQYELNKIELEGLDATDNPNVYIMNGAVVILAENLIE